MAALDDLTGARDSLASKIAAEMANPRPSYSVDGRSFSWTEYRDKLLAQLRELQALINMLDPYVIATQVWP